MSNLIQDFESYYSTIPVFGFNSFPYNLNFTKKHLLSPLLLEKIVVPKVIRQGNKYIGLNFLGLQLLDSLSFLGGTFSLASFLKAYGASEEKRFAHFDWFDSTEKLKATQLPSITSFWSKQKNHNVLAFEHEKLLQLRSIGMGDEDILKKPKGLYKRD